MSEPTQGPGADQVAEAIEAARTVVDPLDGLVERTRKDAGAPFEPEVLRALGELKGEDLAAFQRLRQDLKSANCRVTALNEAIRKLEGPRGEALRQADILAGFADEARLFHMSEGEAFAEIERDGHHETWGVASTGFSRWLRARFFEATGGAPNAEAVKAAVNLIEARAIYTGPDESVFLRSAA